MFRTISSANQPSVYGAVANMCEETRSLPFRSDKTCAIERKTEVLIKSADLLKSPEASADQ